MVEIRGQHEQRLQRKKFGVWWNVHEPKDIHGHRTLHVGKKPAGAPDTSIRNNIVQANFDTQGNVWNVTIGHGTHHTDPDNGYHRNVSLDRKFNNIRPTDLQIQQEMIFNDIRGFTGVALRFAAPHEGRSNNPIVFDNLEPRNFQEAAAHIGKLVRRGRRVFAAFPVEDTKIVAPVRESVKDTTIRFRKTLWTGKIKATVIESGAINPGSIAGHRLKSAGDTVAKMINARKQ